MIHVFDSLKSNNATLATSATSAARSLAAQLSRIGMMTIIPSLSALMTRSRGSLNLVKPSPAISRCDFTKSKLIVGGSAAAVQTGALKLSEHRSCIEKRGGSETNSRQFRFRKTSNFQNEPNYFASWLRRTEIRLCLLVTMDRIVMPETATEAAGA